MRWGKIQRPQPPFVTWQFDNNAKEPYYFWGHYHADRATAERDFHSRVADHKRLYGQREVKPISQQMKEAAKQADADRGEQTPKKKAPDWGDR